MARSDKALEAYLVGIMHDTKASPERRDKAADRLAKHLSTKRKVAMKTKHVRAAARAGKEPKVEKIGKKGRRAAMATETANSDEWSDLIPKAKVVSMDARRKHS